MKSLHTIFAVLFLAYSFHCQSQAPSNDACANAITLTEGSACTTGSTGNATLQGGESTGWCGSTVQQSVWYRFVATSDQMDVWVDNSWSPNTCELASAVWNTGTCVPTGTPSWYKAIGSPTDIWHHLTGLTIGNTYLIQICYRTNGSCNSGGPGQSFCVGAYAPSTTSGYTHPTTGLSSGASIGACVTMTSSGQYYDDGGASANHANSITNGIYRVFCPATVFNCTRVTLNYVNMLPTSDYVRIRNGGSRNGTILLDADMVSPGTQVTSTDSSGCLTFRMYSNASTNRAGWNITISEVSCAGKGPNGTDNNDCTMNTEICSNATFAGNSTGPGLVAESCSSCQHGENYSSWYSFRIATTGTLQFLINPLDNQDDYDFSFYGPATSCSALGNARRCSFGYDASNGDTGTRGASSDTSENASGDGWVANMSVTAGQTFFLVVNNTEADTDSQDDGFTVDFTGSTATLDCTYLLPIQLVSFDAYVDEVNQGIAINWITETEVNNDFFSVERSENGSDFYELMEVDGAGTSMSSNYYYSFDPNPLPGIGYYRLKQIDFDGSATYSSIVAVLNETASIQLTIAPNPVADQLNLTLISPGEEMISVHIFNIQGREMMHTLVDLHKGINEFSTSLTLLDPGFYTIMCNAKRDHIMRKFIKK